MRRVILAIPAILGLLFITSSCVTQGQGQGLTQPEPSPPPEQGQRMPLVQRGMATQENTDEGLTIRHPALPIGSKARVLNIQNGKEIEVTIVNPRISPSATRIADLSPAAAVALDIGKGGPVQINQIFAVRVRAPSAPESSLPPVQGRTPLVQRGPATQENTDEGLTIRHPSLRIYSMARVTNIATGKEIEVIITGRINPSSTRIADLSPATAMELDLQGGGPVMISEILQTQNRPEPSTPLTQRGMATQEMADDDGLFAAHPILPIGSIVKVTNRANDKEIIVIITDRINPSDTRIIDLSPGVALALDIGKGGPVIIEVLSTP